jgi:hypothetical protein
VKGTHDVVAHNRAAVAEVGAQVRAVRIEHPHLPVVVAEEDEICIEVTTG